MTTYYDEIASGYEELHREEQEKKVAIVKKELKITENMLLLDVGCGTGVTSNFPCKIIGVDPAENVAPIARANGIDTIIAYFNDKIAN